LLLRTIFVGFLCVHLDSDIATNAL